MRNLLWLPLCGCLFLMHLSAATLQIQYQVTNLSPGQFEYTYYLSGTLTQYEVVDIAFDGNLYSGLTNGQALPGSNWTLFVFDTIPGGFGDYFLEAKVANPSLTGPFKVDFAYTGGIPGSQAFTLYQYDSNGNRIDGPIGSGNTTAYTASTVPEPSSLWLSALGLLAVGVRRVMRRGARAAA